MMHIKLIVKIVGANQTFSGKLNSCAMSTSISLKTAGRLMCAVIVPLLLAHLAAEMLSGTKTLYNYVDQGLLDIHNYDLPEKLKRNTKLHRIRKNKKKLGRSIEERPKEINKRNEFGHYTSMKLLLLITHFYLFICLLFHSKSDHHYYETKSKSNHIDQPT